MKPVKDRPFYAQFMNSTDGVVTTKKAGPKGNDVDTDTDAGQAVQVGSTTKKGGPKGNDVDSDEDATADGPGPIMTTMKAGTKGNDMDGDTDTGVDAGGPTMTTMKAGSKGNDMDGDDDGFERGGGRPIMTTMKAGPKGNDIDVDADAGGSSADAPAPRKGVSLLDVRTQNIKPKE